MRAVERGQRPLCQYIGPDPPPVVPAPDKAGVIGLDIKAARPPPPGKNFVQTKPDRFVRRQNALEGFRPGLVEKLDPRENMLLHAGESVPGVEEENIRVHSLARKSNRPEAPFEAFADPCNRQL